MIDEKEVTAYVTIPDCFLQGCSEDIVIFRADGGNHFECLNKIYYPSVYKRFDALADFLGCSKKALAIRMKQLGLLKKEYLDNPFDLVTVYPEVSEL